MDDTHEDRSKRPKEIVLTQNRDKDKD